MGQRFLSLAGEQVGSQTCPALQLKGAALGVRSVLTAGAERPALSERGPSSFRAGRSGRGQEERPLGGEPGYLASTLRAGRLPGLRVGTDPPPSSAAAPFICFIPSYSPGLLFLPIVRPLSPRASLAARVPARLAAARPVGHRLLAAHSSRHRASGPAPEEGAAGKLEPGLNRLRCRSRTSAPARRAARVPRPHPRRLGIGKRPKCTRK